MKKKAVLSAMIAAGLVVSQTAAAELFVNPALKNGSGKFSLGIDYTSSEFTTVDDAGLPSDFERTIYSVTGIYGMSEAVDVYATFGAINKTTIDWVSVDGDGSLFAVGIKGALTNNPGGNVHGFAQYISSTEDFSGDEIDGSVFSAGAAYVVDVDSLRLFASAEFVAGTFDFVGAWEEDNDDDFVIRGGGSYDVNGLAINAGLALVGEKGFTLGITKKF